MRSAFRTLIVLVLVSFGPDVAFTQTTSIEPSATDNGKMWAFEYPPTEYLAQTYDFHPDEAWFERARMSSLRVPGCSASFVSPNGLVVTNHHCVRSRVSQVSTEQENLLDNGFFARSLDEERPLPDYYADQLIAIEDVTDEVDASADGAETDAERAAAREAAMGTIRDRIKTERGDAELQVQIISLYHGGRYSAYIFKRYTDVRLVMAVELQSGFFGGEPDNFTYPRYALDYSFLRIYGADGKPVSSPYHYTFSEEGVEEGDLVFVIGNPGSTRRLLTISQLQYVRDVQVKYTLAALNSRLAAMRDFYAENPEAGEAMNIRNTIFSASNSQKAYAGRSAALGGSWLIPRRRAAEAEFQNRLEAAGRTDELMVFGALASLQEENRDLGSFYAAFRFLESFAFSDAITRRALAAARYARAVESGMSAEQTDQAMAALADITDRHPELERRMLAIRLREFEDFLPTLVPKSEVSYRVSSEALSDGLLKNSMLATQESTRRALETGTLSTEDPVVSMGLKILPIYNDYRSAATGLQAREGELTSALGRARFDIYGTAVPPDATFSPRFTDGIVKGYEYNGTRAPAYTTIYGMYDRAYSHGHHPDWQLAPKLVDPPSNLNLKTPLNFTSTSDTIGGNSGSPAVTRNLELVGLNFDRNIEGLSRDYIYMADQGRNVMVDMRAVKETLDKVYDMDRIVLELTTGTLVEDEIEADEL